MSWIAVLINRLGRWDPGEEGATIAEYALLLALVVVVLIGALGTLGDALVQRIEALATQISGAS